jgi:hypothetical protein
MVDNNVYKEEVVFHYLKSSNLSVGNMYVGSVLDETVRLFSFYQNSI